MKRKRVTTGPIHGPVKEAWDDRGPGHAHPHPKWIGGRRPGTKQPGSSAGSRERQKR